MRETFLPFSKPSIEEWEISEVAKVLRSGWITTGPKNAEFEKAFCEYTGAKYAIPLTSETTVMQALFRAIGLKPGDEVITPSMTWVSLPNIVSLYGAKPVFVDCDRDTLMVTPEAVEAAITPNTKAIVPVHFAGGVLELDKLRAIADKHGVMLIEDAAHALGAEFKGERIGKHGTAMFSFHPIKNITTGEGGMFATDDAALADRVRSLKFHGLGVDAYDRQTMGRAPQAQVVEPGFKFNMPDMQAVLGVTQLTRVDRMNAERGRLAALYRTKKERAVFSLNILTCTAQQRRCENVYETVKNANIQKRAEAEAGVKDDPLEEAQFQRRVLNATFQGVILEVCKNCVCNKYTVLKETR